MPICEITYAKGIIKESELESIIEKLTPILLKAEGFEDNSVSRSLCLININDSNSFYIGGKRSKYGKIIIKIYVFSEAYSDSIKIDLHSEINELFKKENKHSMEQNGGNIWCIILPVEKNNFGVGGIPITLEMTKQIISSS